MRSTRSGPSALRHLSDELVRLTARALRATAAIAGPTPQGTSSGSGFVADGDGHVLTNHHVIEGMTPPITVTLHGGVVTLAGVVGSDPVSDLAVLKLDRRWKHTLRIRRSPARAGELCLACGNPLGRYPETVTIGIVSGLARTAVAGPGRPHYDLLQTDCDIQEGNSGGPLIDAEARVIGMTMLLDRDSPHIGLAVRAETILAVFPELVKHGSVLRGTLGISVVKRVQTIEGTDVAGLEVVGLTRERGQRLKTGDFLWKVQGALVPDPQSLFAQLGRAHVGRPLRLEVVRRGKPRTLTVKPWPLDKPA